MKILRQHSHVLSDIRTEHHLNMRVGSYRYANRSVKLSFLVRKIHIYF
jgi:hypothetical protein